LPPGQKDRPQVQACSINADTDCVSARRHVLIVLRGGPTFTVNSTSVVTDLSKLWGRGQVGLHLMGVLLKGIAKKEIALLKEIFHH
jgi:hypothetical protein